jgi:hypothetical protein
LVSGTGRSWSLQLLKVVLERGAGGVAAVEERVEELGALVRRTAGPDIGERSALEVAAVKGVVDGALALPVLEQRRAVEHGARWAGDADAELDGEVAAGGGCRDGGW